MSYRATQTIKVVTGREIQVMLRSKGLIASTVITLLVMVAAIIGFDWFQERNDQPLELVVVGVTAEAFPDTITVTTAPDRATAEAQVKDGKDAALIATDQGFDLLADGTPSDTLTTTITATVQRLAQTTALTKLNVDQQQYAQAVPPATVTPVNIGKDVNQTQLFTTVFGVLIVLMFIMMFAATVGSRVTEEKSSRIVEIILSSVRPLDFLSGKLMGSLIIGTISTLIIITVGVITLQFTGMLDNVSISYSMISLLVIGFILGMLFFSSLYAAAGAMVSRTEDLQSTQSPILMLLIGTIYTISFGSPYTSSTIIQVLSWLPPFSIGLAPIQYATGGFNLIQLIAAYGVLAATTAAVLWLSARIYQGAILHNGQKLTWTQALSVRHG